MNLRFMDDFVRTLMLIDFPLSRLTFIDSSFVGKAYLRSRKCTDEWEIYFYSQYVMHCDMGLLICFDPLKHKGVLLVELDS